MNKSVDKNKKEEKKQTLYPFRNLENYKRMHVGAAEARGKRDAFLAASTLTAARRLAFG